MRRSLLLALVLATLAAPAEAQFGWPFGSSEKSTKSSNERVGTKAWWKKHKKKAILVPRQGYQVPGFPGYYDGQGVPISASVDEQSIRLTNEEQDSGGLLPGLDPKKAVASVREATGYGESEAVARALFGEGVSLFEDNKFGPAASKFRGAADRWPGTDLAGKALFNLAESRFFDEKYSAASDAYVELLEKHPSTPKLDLAVERLWDIAQHWERSHFQSDSWRLPFDANFTERTRPGFDTIGNAVRLYEAIRLNDPTGPRADDAIMATAEVYRRKQRFVDADYHYTLVREEYPRSKHQFEAHLRGLEAKLARYYGPDYDGTPLREAQRLEELTRANFAGRLSDEERERLRDARARIARAIEGRDLRLAEYYEGAEHFGASTYYLKQFVEQHPESPAVDRVKEKITQNQGKPASPDVPLEFMVNLFPENKRFEKIRAVNDAAPAVETPAPGLPPGSGQTLVAEQPGETATR